MQVFLETERLVLRRFTENDVDLLFDLDSDLQVMRYLNGGMPTPRGVIEHEILPKMIIAGFATVTITSVIVTSIIAGRIGTG